MQVVLDAFRATDLPHGGVVTIGNYDGIHLGQRQVLERVVARARTLGVPAVVVSFQPHPVAILRPDEAPPALTTAAQRERLLDEIGVDVVLTIRFTRDFAALSAEEFVRGFLVGRLAAREVYVGSRFGFGRGREGDLALLTRMGAELGFTAVGVEELTQRGEAVSATRIRRAIGEGRVEDAAAMLGRPYAITGVIVRGDRMGKRLGWPTVNVAADHELLPADGVYCTRVHFPSFPATFDCATNIGSRPTVYENFQRVVEGHILDFSSDVYGERVELAFHRRLREERIFPSVMDLSQQIRRDVDATRQYFAARRRAEEEKAAPAELG
ncbi:MAG: bifunctional riboflavin kinase/FAD synthetase [Holophagales bacterium]|nr:MAG: bifunctional riboflavin kinase/FAD synthetase [Holophagales bacterium]